MTTPPLKLYPSVLLENGDLEQRLDFKLNDVKKLDKSNENIQEKIIYFKDKNHKSKQKMKKL